jgi:tetratricopeptide (TPR) repeat protein
LPIWKAYLDAYRINYIILPFVSISGETIPLANALLKDKDWIPVCPSLNSTVYVRNAPENYEIMRKYSISGERLLNDLILECDKIIKASPVNIYAHLAKGELYLAENKLVEAKKMYEKVRHMAPINALARYRLTYLAGTGGLP